MKKIIQSIKKLFLPKSIFDWYLMNGGTKMKTDQVKVLFKSIYKDYKHYSVIKNKENKDINYQCFYYSFDRAMEALSERSKEILNRSYFQVEYPFWWLDFYSSTTYYRYRSKAINSFVFIFTCANESFKARHSTAN